MGDGFWVFPLVRRDRRHRRLAHVHGVARRAAYARNRRIGRLSLLREDAGAARSGSWPWIRKRTHRCRSWLRPGPGHVFRRHAHGALRLEAFLSRPWRRPHRLGYSLGLVGGSGEDSRSGFLQLLKQRSMWGTCGGLFGANYVLYFEITWLPFYLVRERHLSMGTMAKIVGRGYLG